MSKIGLIIKREYIQRVSKKSFLLITILMPFLVAAIVFVPLWLSTIKSDEAKKIAVIDSTGKYISHFADTQELHFLATDSDLNHYRKEADRQIDAVLSISDDLLQHPKAAVLYSEKQIPLNMKGEVNRQLKEMLQKEKIESYNIPELERIIHESEVTFDVQTVKWDENGQESNSSAEMISIIGLVLSMMIYMFITIYGSIVMHGVMEEKTNRIIEIMISSVKPFDLMLGKIAGIGFVGLTQVFLWAILSVFFINGSLLFFGDSSQTTELVMNSQLDQVSTLTGSDALPANDIQMLLQSIPFASIGINFILYFIGGYLLYSSLFAAIGSAVNQQEDAQQFMMPMMIFMIFALYTGLYSIENPDGPLAVWCSFIPFTSPIVMMVRMPYEIPVWQNVLSLILLYGTAMGAIWVSGKIYRIGILMYGKKPNFKELIRWIGYKG